MGRSTGKGYGNRLQCSYLEKPHGQKQLVGYSSWGCKQWTWLVTLMHACMYINVFNSYRRWLLLFPFYTRHKIKWLNKVKKFSSVTQSYPTLCDPMNRSTPGLPVHHQLPESTQTHVHRVNDAIQPSHPLSSPSPPALSLSQHQGLFQWVNFSHQVAKVLEFQLQRQSFQWTPRTDLL